MPVAWTTGERARRTEPEAEQDLAVARPRPFDWAASDGATYRVNLLDTPGYADFEGEVDAAMSVADLAVFVVSAVDGVEVATELLWRKADQRRLPRMVFVNKEDKERADFHAVLAQLTASFGSGFAPLELPIEGGRQPARHADVLSEQALEYEPGGTHHSEAMPADVADEEHRLHDSLVEEIVSGDDEQLERYLSGDGTERRRTRTHAAPRGARLPRVPRAARVRRDRGGDRPTRRLHLRARAVAARPSGR
ncbi:MAG: GTP-binding protein [Ilumatobacteraceae bacterium]